MTDLIDISLTPIAFHLTHQKCVKYWLQNRRCARVPVGSLKGGINKHSVAEGPPMV